MGMKLNRGRSNVFRKKNTVLPTVLWIVAAVGVVALGFFGAKLLDSVPPDTHNPESSTVNPPENQPDSSDPGTKPEPDVSQPAGTQPEATGALRAFYLPASALRDTAALSLTLEQAATAGFNSVVFDLKDATGTLYYRFTSPMAQQVNSYTADALTAEELARAITTIQEKGFRAVPRLHAYRDHLGAKALSAARITPTGNSGWVWYDNDPKTTGRAWLNPYADEAHSYIIGLALELKEAGVAAILLDSVQFPEQTSSADYGKSSNTALAKDEVLALFVQKAKTALEDTPVILGCTTLGALGTKTTVYGNNPLTLAPAMAAPAVLPGSLPATIRIGDTVITNKADDLEGTVKALVGQMVLRTKVIEEAARPALIPLLQAEGYSATQILQEIAGCLAGGAEQYIVYSPNGSYDFAGLAG